MRKYLIKPDRSLHTTFGGHKLTNDNITDEIAEKIIKDYPQLKQHFIINDMSKFKGTKGNWRVVDDYDNYVPYSIDTPQIYIWDGDEQSGKSICDMGEMGDMNYAEELANARLIAAAPELLEALTYLREWIKNYPANQFALEMADKATNKALNG